jgi:hypothetical protein
MSKNTFFSLLLLLIYAAVVSNSFVLQTNPIHHSTILAPLYLVQTSDQGNNESLQATSRRRRTIVTSALIGIMAAPQLAQARFILDDETGDYIEVKDEEWQTAWKQRLDKAQAMSTDEVFKAARGAGNLDLKQGEESDASKKRRAMSACRDADVRAKAGAGNEPECTKRVFSGDVDFLLNQL